LRFVEEAQIASQLEHPGVVPIHDLAVDGDGLLFFTMRLVEGDTLSSALEEHRAGSDTWTQVRLLEVLVRICDAVAFAHDRGVLHRDLKPQNVLLGRFGEVYVTDWGLAKLLDRGGPAEGDGSSEGEGPAKGNSSGGELRSARADRFADDPDSAARTVAGSIVGTPNYMPPEQAGLNEGRVDERSDVYGLGSMLYELLAGAAPYAERGRTGLQILTGLVEGPPRPLGELAPRTPPELIAICERAMARNREDRYAGAEALRDDLRAYLENRVVRAHRTGPLAELRKWYRRNRAFATTLAASLLVVVLGLGLFSYFQNQARVEIERLADLKVARDLLREEATLWPAHPERIGDFEDWLSRADDLMARVEDHDERLQRLSRRASSSVQGQWVRETLTDLTRAIEELRAEDGAIDSVRWRMDLARRVRSESIDAPAEAWEQARERVAENSEYEGLDLPPQLGLIPLGPDPESDFELFAVWGTGELPTDLAAQPAAEDAVVLTLIPALDFRMGGMRAPLRRDDDELEILLGLDEVAPTEGPDDDRPVLVQLDPYFIGKHEVTQAQWQRLVGSDPSFATSRTIGQLYTPLDERDPGPRILPGVHPVERVHWADARAGLGRLGLDLPTEAQWEAAARAGGDEVWWTGDYRWTLIGAGNFADATLRKYAHLQELRDAANHWPDNDDGFAYHAPIGSFEPNLFGLHDVLGNVYEWVRDGYFKYDQVPPRPGDGLRAGDSSQRVCRGGAWNHSYQAARSRKRWPIHPSSRLAHVGLRAARALEP
ncbi:MAG: bifunctional serine/threonine-protein kinase/formylglycine-generating enzyme family protein, partial [Planctomycetota bacterium]